MSREIKIGLFVIAGIVVLKQFMQPKTIASTLQGADSSPQPDLSNGLSVNSNGDIIFSTQA